MREQDREAFASLLSDAMAFYRQDMNRFALSVWWQACAGFDIEQVRKAITAHAMDPERGQFAPKPADIVRQLQGTQTDRALVAWGKFHEAMQRVGAYTSVVFDDPVIHAVAEDLGGWVAACRAEVDELPHLQRRFCDSYRAYARREDVPFPAKLLGSHDQDNAARGYRHSSPAYIGNTDKARKVLQLGATGPKTQIVHISDVPRLEAAR